jgi:serine protease Do
MRKIFGAIMVLVAGQGMAGSAEVVAIDERVMWQAVERVLGGRLDEGGEGGLVGGQEIGEQLEAAEGRGIEGMVPEAGGDGAAAPGDIYIGALDGVVAIASVYKCDRCDAWHRGGGATGWALAPDMVVTNHHVLSGSDHPAFAAVTREGEVFPVIEVLAADRASDLAVVRVDLGGAAGLKPLPVGKGAAVGEAVSVISHPAGQCYTLTVGHVSRYIAAPGRGAGAGAGQGTPWMVITAPFARGSSGGPVFDSGGRVVGMATSTRTLYHPGDRGEEGEEENGERRGGGPHPQMVFFQCSPVAALWRLLGEG